MTTPRIRPPYAGFLVALVATLMLAVWIILLRAT